MNIYLELGCCGWLLKLWNETWISHSNCRMHRVHNCGTDSNKLWITIPVISFSPNHPFSLFHRISQSLFLYPLFPITLKAEKKIIKKKKKYSICSCLDGIYSFKSFYSYNVFFLYIRNSAPRQNRSTNFIKYGKS